MPKIDIKPISVNDCWQGRRFKTPKYTAFEKEMMLKIRKEKLPPSPYRITISFGFANRTSDIDNPVKPLLDVLQKKLNFNDKNIYELHVYKNIVKKGKEFIHYEITSI